MIPFNTVPSPANIQTDVLCEGVTKTPSNTFITGKTQYVSTTDGFSFSVVICRSDGAEVVVPHYTLTDSYFHYFTGQVSPLFRKAITNLLNIRKYLALQLDLEYGNISEEYFAAEEKTCLLEAEKLPFDRLEREVDLLFRMSNMALDSEEVSGILNCPIDDAERAIRNVLLKD